MEEVWKDDVDYPDYYKISNFGNVFSKRTNKIVKFSYTETGYSCVSTKFGGRKSRAFLIRVHRMVAKAFIENPKNKPFVNHKDGNKKNNYVTNLEWVTNLENIHHAMEFGLRHYACGENAGAAKLNWEQVCEIREKYLSGKYTQEELGNEYGVHRTKIGKIVNFKSYLE